MAPRSTKGQPCLAPVSTANTLILPPPLPEESELNVGDLVMFTGRVSEHNIIHRRIIYKVVAKDSISSPWAKFNYKYRVAFDFENPLGTELDSTGSMSDRDLKKISLLDLGVIRLMFDNFIKEWSHKQGFDAEHVPSIPADTDEQ